MATVLTTAIILIFGETLPKIIAAAIPDSVAALYAYPLNLCMIIFKPIVWIVNKFVNILSPIWTPKEYSPNVTSEELCEILDDIEEEGVFSEDESELIKSAIEFTDTTAKDILIPRVDVFAIDIDEPFELTEEIYKYTRIPVYKDNIDNIIGVITTKQLMKTLAADKELNLLDIMFKPIFVHMTRTISSIIEEFREKHQQLAIVVDEYGGTMGILTLEDITEEIVGEIFDERDSFENDIISISDNIFEIDGGTNIYDVFDEIEFDEPNDFESEYTTIGGWATEMLDKFPEVGDSFEFENIKVTITQAEQKRVIKLQIEILPIADDE